MEELLKLFKVLILSRKGTIVKGPLKIHLLLVSRITFLTANTVITTQNLIQKKYIKIAVVSNFCANHDKIDLIIAAFLKE